MKLRVLLRQLHHWGSIIIALPVLVLIGAGILLMLKKDVSWIQPPTATGVARAAIPALDMTALFEAAGSVPEAGFESWADMDRVDIKPDKGVVKFIGVNRWEVQVDTATGEILHVAFRRSDLIESIHDGSFFADWSKLYLFFPAGVGLFILWATGIYMFVLPHAMRARRRKRKAGQGH